MTHISEQVAQELKILGWLVAHDEQGFVAQKMINGYETPGQMSNGTRLVTLEIDSTGRWFSRVDGWGKVIKDVDLRNFSNDPQGAIDEILKNN